MSPLCRIRLFCPKTHWRLLACATLGVAAVLAFGAPLMAQGVRGQPEQTEASGSNDENMATPTKAQASAQMPPDMVPLGPPENYPAPEAWTPPPNYVPGRPYYPVPAYVPPEYPPDYAPPGYLPAPPIPSPPPSEADIAFQKAFGQIMPLTNGMTQRVRKEEDEQQKIISMPASGKLATPVSRSISLTLHPGEKPPVVHLSSGNATVLTFSDQTGASWPVTSVAVGNPQEYAAQEAGDKGKTNMIVVSPLTNYGAANLIVTLANMPVPVAFSLETGGDAVDYRLDVGVPGRGPNAQYDIAGITSLAPTNDSVVQAFLDGISPRGAIKLKTSRNDIEAWKFKDMVYIRTQCELLSPAYIGRARNVSGINVYTMASAPVLIVSLDGRMSSVMIED